MNKQTEKYKERLSEINHKIKDGTIASKDIEEIIFGNSQYTDVDIRSDEELVNTLKEINNNLNLIRDKFAEYFGCKEDEIYIGDINFSKHPEINKCPYKVILGNAAFKNSNVKDASNLEVVLANLDVSDSKVENLDNLTIIGHNAWFSNSNVDKLPKLEYIGNSGFFENVSMTNLDSLSCIKFLYIDDNFRAFLRDDLIYNYISGPKKDENEVFDYDYLVDRITDKNRLYQVEIFEKAKEVTEDEVRDSLSRVDVDELVMRYLIIDNLKKTNNEFADKIFKVDVSKSAIKEMKDDKLKVLTTSYKRPTLKDKINNYRIHAKKDNLVPKIESRISSLDSLNNNVSGSGKDSDYYKEKLSNLLEKKDLDISISPFDKKALLNEVKNRMISNVCNKVKNGDFSDENIDFLANIYTDKEKYLPLLGEETYNDLTSFLYSIKPQIARRYHVSEDGLYIGNVNKDNYDRLFRSDYKAILGCMDGISDNEKFYLVMKKEPVGNFKVLNFRNECLNNMRKKIEPVLESSENKNIGKSF